MPCNFNFMVYPCHMLKLFRCYHVQHSHHIQGVWGREINCIIILNPTVKLTYQCTFSFHLTDLEDGVFDICWNFRKASLYKSQSYVLGTDWKLRIRIFSRSSIYVNMLTNSVAWVRDRTVPTERLVLVGDVTANFCMVSAADPLRP
jgi:hypothetical protein